mmetsp:Transcript_1474/g.3765  ORF Transcript_1474/g.3765 Transcript_1474/m.3765 type:complete len:244 (+) Transcript_1474:1021-1752(+)
MAQRLEDGPQKPRAQHEELHSVHVRPNAEAQYLQRERRPNGTGSDDLEEGRRRRTNTIIFHATHDVGSRAGGRDHRRLLGCPYLVSEGRHEPRDVPIVEQRQERVLLRLRGPDDPTGCSRRQRSGMIAARTIRPAIAIRAGRTIIGDVEIILLVQEISPAQALRRRWIGSAALRAETLAHTVPRHLRVQHDPDDFRSLQQQARVGLARHDEEQRQEQVVGNGVEYHLSGFVRLRAGWREDDVR